MVIMLYSVVFFKALISFMQSEKSTPFREHHYRRNILALFMVRRKKSHNDTILLQKILSPLKTLLLLSFNNFIVSVFLFNYKTNKYDYPNRCIYKTGHMCILGWLYSAYDEVFIKLKPVENGIYSHE
jgi:hypothetical protein